jgi:outer membrane protein
VLIRMTRLTITALAVLVAGGAVFAQPRAQAAGQTTPPPTTTQKPIVPPAAPPAAQTPAPKPTPAPPPPFPAGATIAYVQMQAVIAESKFGKCGSDILKAMKEKDQAALAPKQKELQTLEAKMQSQQGVVNDMTMTQMQRDHDRIQREGQAMVAQYQTDEDNKNQDLLNDFQSKVLPLLEALRKEKDLSIILSADMNGAIVAANTALDLTPELVKRLDAAYPDCTKKIGGN